MTHSVVTDQGHIIMHNMSSDSECGNRPRAYYNAEHEQVTQSVVTDQGHITMQNMSSDSECGNRPRGIL